jgi:SAM-dependent methyltransferase
MCHRGHNRPAPSPGSWETFRLNHTYLISKINSDIAKSLPYRGRVVDMGCGNAPYKQIILSKADEYVGVDWPSSKHDTSQVDIFANLAGPLPLDSDWADTITSFQVLEHLSEPEFFLRECCRILRRGGQILMTVPFMWRVHEAPHDYYRYTSHGLEYLLEKAGFVDITLTANTGVWQTLALKFSYQTAKRARGILKPFFGATWWVLQHAAPILDRYDPNPAETASYTVTARKPD